MENIGFGVKRIASTRWEEEGLEEAHDRGVGQKVSSPRHVSCVQQAELSADGSCIMTSDYDRTASVYILSDQNTALFFKASLKCPEPIWALTSYPYFTTSDPDTSLILLSTRANFISLHDISSQASIYNKICAYNNIDPLNETLRVPHSLLFTSSGTTFLAGSQNLISLYDINDSSAPVSAFRTHSKDDPQGYRGIVSALSISTDGILAAGTWTRYVGLYDAEGSGAAITTISLPGGPTWLPRDSRDQDNDNALRGNGVSQLQWSPCGRYIYVAERMSDVLLLYDIRNMSLGLAHCKSRNARTKQKLGFQVWSGRAGEDIFTLDHEVWAGGVDGMVRVWRDPHLRAGGLEADDVVRVGEDPVVGTMLNREGTCLVAASGRLDAVFPGEEDEGEGRGRLSRHGRVRERGAVDVFSLQGVES
ncbi:WD40-repeat-containing domain protein [Clohesyomyces aquaticus]|uniref:WD40-repeat-containing domain protein n=1 Tax=Clohesyomyces aquaticus TaxID=1231657 RepID=A0A1Y1ZZI1_9PLEO|nr:WD40-repeat-containing domain protein [Clohesyomyces aquaticus]